MYVGAKLKHYSASRGNATLDQYGDMRKTHVGRVVRETSVKSNSETEKETQIMYMLDLYRTSTEGLTDDEMKEELKKRGVVIPNSTVSARRNDINKNHVRFCEKNGLNSSYLIVSDRKRSNPTPPFRMAMVWTLNKYSEE